MSITTHDQLLTAVADYLGARGTDLASVDDDFVLLCEARLNYGNADPDPRLQSPALRCREMEQRATATATGEFIALPTDYLAMKALKLTGTSPPRQLKAMPKMQFDAVLDTSDSGTPVWYEVINNEIRLAPIPTSSALEILYYKKIPALVSNDPNWLLSDHPGIYLYGTLLEAAIYIKEDSDFERFGRQFSSMVTSLNNMEEEGAHASPLVARSEVRAISNSYVRG